MLKRNLIDLFTIWFSNEEDDNVAFIYLYSTEDVYKAMLYFKSKGYETNLFGYTEYSPSLTSSSDTANEKCEKDKTNKSFSHF